MTLDELCQRRAAVWGLGQEGMATAALLIGRGVVPVLIDDDVEAASVRATALPKGAPAVVAPASAPWSRIEAVVRAPGVGRYRPELTAAAASGTAVTTAMAMWLEDFAGAPVVAITGTKGKSTTAALTASILRHEGMRVALIGNIGVPVIDMYDRPPVDAYVVEVSSYQAADVTVTPGVCVLTGLAPDHLDWHGGEERYYRDKLRLIESGPPGVVAVNAASPEAVRRTDGHPRRTLFGPAGRVRVDPSGTIEVDGAGVVDSARLRPPGHHNVWNLCGAIAGTMLLGGRCPSPGSVGAAVDGFDGLPSRCRTIGERDGLTFVDDALASNPSATVASVEAFPGRELTVILGGADRGVDVRPLVGALARRTPTPRVILLRPDGQHLLAALGPSDGRPQPAVPTREAGGIDEAVRAAVEWTPEGGVILFSPAAPTPGGQGGFGERSRQFVAASAVADRPGRPGGPSARTATGED
ncbi:MAG TPA: UDP-N-acetylmuramoyl-L-alanine--D-glutamate ligase [Acidimicrobiales bacterium]